VPKIVDSSGEEVSLQVSPGQMMRFSDPNAGLGTIEPVDLAKLIEASKYWVEAGAGVTRTPQYLFQSLGGSQPSGESLKNQEIGLINKVKRRQKIWGNSWEDILYLSARLWNLYGTPSVEIARMATQWRDPQIEEAPDVVEARKAQTALVKKQLGVSPQQLQKELGYSDEKIAQMAADNQANGAALGDAMLSAFNKGQ
jgi:hypothetical protein